MRIYEMVAVATTERSVIPSRAENPTCACAHVSNKANYSTGDAFANPATPPA